MKGLFRLLPAVLVVAAAAELPAQEWTRFRGPNGTGLSDAKTIPITWSEADYNWKTKLPGIGHASPVIWGEKIFLTSGDEETATRYCLCLSTVDGRILWTRSYDSSAHKKHRFNSYASATPAVDELHVYFVWSTPEQYTLLALDHEGREVWQRDLGPYVSQHSSGISPIVYKDLVVLGNDQDEEGGGKSFLIAVDRRTGETRWKIDRTSDVVAYSTPCIYQPEGGPAQLIFNSKAHGITSVDPETGRVNWEVSGLFDKRTCSSSLLAGELLIGSCGVGSGGNYLVAIHPGDTGKPTAGQLAYKLDKSAPYVPTPIAVGELLFALSDQGVLTCAKAATGEVLYQKRVGGNFFGSPVAVDGKIYAIDTNGRVVVIAASEEYQLLAENELGEMSHSTPAVAGGRMYLRTFSHLISIGGK